MRLKGILHKLAAGILCAGTLFSVAEAGDRVALSDANYERLFGTAEIAEAANDPELAATMKRFVYGDVATQVKLPDRERQLVTIVTLATHQSRNLLRRNVEGALNLGVTPLEVREAIYQVTPYLGFARAFEALEIINGVFKERGVALPLPSQATVTEENRHEKGLEIRLGIYGDRIRQSMANAPNDMKHIQDNLSEFCFGDTYTRGTLDFKTRELLTVSVLAALGTEPQMKGHIKGNIAVGNNRETVIAAITVALPYNGFPRTLNALRCVNEAAPLPEP